MKRRTRLYDALLAARILAGRDRSRQRYEIRDLISDAIELVEEGGPESSGEEMHPPTNGTLDARIARVAPANKVFQDCTFCRPAAH